MPIETFGSIAELNPAYPAPSDGIVGGDDHIRGIKAAIKTTFPNVDDPVTTSSANLNAAGALVDNGVSKLADGGVKFKTNIKDGLENPSAGKVVVTAQDGSAVKQTVIEVTGADKKLKVLGPLQAAGAITGPGSVPIGASVMWFSNTLPTDAGWAWANGMKVNVADNPVLAVLWSDRLTDGGTKIPMPDLRETVPVGSATMGATTKRGILSQFTDLVLTTIGGLFGSATNTLVTGNLPPYTPSGANSIGGSIPITISGGTQVFGGTAGVTVGQGSGNGVQNILQITATASTANLTSTFAGAPQGGASSPLNNAQPSTVVNWIIRIG